MEKNLPAIILPIYYQLPNSEELLFSPWVLKIEGHNEERNEFDFFNSQVPQWNFQIPEI